MGKLANGDFLQLICNAPLVASDLVVKAPSGRVLLVERRDEPARGFYFVPGGRIFKNKKIGACFKRILANELGLSAGFQDARLLGLYQHIYDTIRFEEKGTGAHHVVLAHEICLHRQPELEGVGRHRWS